MTTRMNPKDRRIEILDAAMRVSRIHGYQNATRKDIADLAECSEALVSSYFGTMTQVRRTIMRAAVKQRDLTIVAQGIVANDSYALKAPLELRKAALQSRA